MHDKQQLIAGLRWDSVQFGSLRYQNITHWDCPDQLPTFAGCEWVGNTLTPTDPYADPPPANHRADISQWFATYWYHIFGNELGTLPRLVGWPLTLPE